MAYLVVFGLSSGFWPKSRFSGGFLAHLVVFGVSGDIWRKSRLSGAFWRIRWFLVYQVVFGVKVVFRMVFGRSGG